MPRLPLIDCTALLAQPERLCAQAHETGYLYFPAIVPTHEVSALRADLLALAAAPQHGWLAVGTAPDAAVAAPDVFECEDLPTPSYIAYYNAAQSLRSLHALPHSPGLLAALEILFGEEPLVFSPQSLNFRWKRDENVEFTPQFPRCCTENLGIVGKSGPPAAHRPRYIPVGR